MEFSKKLNFSYLIMLISLNQISTVNSVSIKNSDNSKDVNIINEGKVSAASGCGESQPYYYCGYIIPLSGGPKKLCVGPNGTIGPTEFTTISKQFNEEAVIFVKRKNCSIEICGFSQNSGLPSDHGHCQVFDDCEKGLDGSCSTSEPLPLSYRPYANTYELTSVSCGCKLKPDYKKVLGIQNSQDNCAMLFQETNFKETIYPSILLGNGNEYSTSNFAVIRSIKIVEGCTVAQTTFGHLKESFSIPKIITLTGNVKNLEPSFHKNGEHFKCSCAPLISNFSSEMPAVTSAFTIAYSTSTERYENDDNTSTYWSSPTTDITQTTSSTEQIFTSTLQSYDENEQLGILSIIIIILGSIALLTAFLIVCYFRRRLFNESVQTEESCISSSTIMTNLSKISVEQNFKESDNYSVADSNITSSEYNFDIKRSSILIELENPETIIGKGGFGLVFAAKLLTGNNCTTKDVAVKTIAPNSPPECIESLINEIKLLKFIGSFGQNPYIVNFLGACIINQQSGEILSVMELCKLGSLKTYLTSQRHHELMIKKINTKTGSNYAYTSQKYFRVGESRNSSKLFMYLLKWSKEIASGMIFLSQKNVLHIDLSARNVLLSDNMTAKISDFGMSKKLYDKTYYGKSANAVAPIKWIALECMTENKYSIKSDVWSYGVTLWEIFSLGRDPYPGRGVTEVFTYLQSGKRLPFPECATDQIFAKMASCWDKEPTLRPRFTEIELFFQETISNIYSNTND